MRRPISIHFHPFNFEDREHAIEKADDSGVKRRYLQGIATGSNMDEEGERLTSNCIESLDKQAKEKDILLMSDLHGKGATEDIGRLTDSEIKPNGDWFIETRLYDEHDDIGPSKLEKANDLWKQMKGLPPYTKPKQKGFSIEGYLTDLEGTDSTTNGRIINDMELDYVAVVPRPAYNDSVAHAIAKSLGSKSDWAIRKNLLGRLERKKKENEEESTYHNEKWDLEGAFEEVICEIMESASEDKHRELNVAGSEYITALINLLMRYEDTFTSRDSTEGMGVVKTMGRLLNIAKTHEDSDVRKKLTTLHTLLKSVA